MGGSALRGRLGGRFSTQGVFQKCLHIESETGTMYIAELSGNVNTMLLYSCILNYSVGG